MVAERSPRIEARRTALPDRFIPLIRTRDVSTGWQQGLEQDRPADEPVLDVVVSRPERKQPDAYPVLTWWGWKPPQTDPDAPGGDRWSFGSIATDLPPRPLITRRLSWNTEEVDVSTRAGD